MQTILVTGSTGLIGQHLIPQIKKDHHVIELTRALSFQQSANAIHLDLSKDWDANRLPEKIDKVIYLAQSEHFRDFPVKADDIFNVNTTSVLRLLDYARQAQCQTFIYASSGGVYGNQSDAFKEDLKIPAGGHLGFYLSTKMCSEILLENYSDLMNIVILRFFFVYGPGQRSSMLIPRLIQNVQAQNPIVLQGQEGIKINPTYVSDAVTALQASLNLTGLHTINVAGPEELSLKQIGDLIGQYTNQIPRFEWQEGEAKSIIGDIAKMTELLGHPQINFEEGLKRLLKAMELYAD